MASTSSNSVVIIVFPLAYLDVQFYVISCLSNCVMEHFSLSRDVALESLLVHFLGLMKGKLLNKYFSLTTK